MLYQKHVVERKEFPEIESIQDFIELIQQVIVSGQKKVLFGDRIAYWSSFQRTVVIYPIDEPQKGTAFRPKNGEEYFNNLL